jgi:outer membrane protein assembly factor BamB
VDGDTGLPVKGVRIGAKHAVRRGSLLFVQPGLRWLTVNAWAPHYTAATVTVSPAKRHAVTVRLYRPAGQWLVYGGDSARTQGLSTIQIRPPFRIVWSKFLGSLLEFPAVVDDGVAYINTFRGHVYALSMDDGHTLWTTDLHTYAQAASPGVVGPYLVEDEKAGRVVVLQRATGRVLWGYPTAGDIESSPVVEGGVDYFGDWSGRVYALDLHTRKARWIYHDGCKITASMALVGGLVYFGDYCGRIVALHQGNGAVAWTRSAGGTVYGTSAVDGGRVFVPSRAGEALYAFTTSGQYLWHVPAGALVYSAPAVSDGRVYFGSYTGELYCVSAATGSVLWRAYAGGRISGSPTVIDGVVYVGSFGHTIIGADSRTGRVLFHFPHGAYVAVSGNRGRLLLHGWATVWAVEPRTKR